MLGLRGIDNLNAHDYQRPPRFRGWVFCAFRSVVVVAVFLQLVGCQRATNLPLKDRVGKYWELKQQKRWEEVYDGYLDPALKGVLSKDAFLKKRLLAFDVVNFTIIEANENGDQGTVRIKMDANLPLRGIGGKVQMRRQEMMSEESWVKREGTWYIHLSE